MENLINNKISKEKQENVKGGDSVPLICQACGAAVAGGASVCGNCGEPIELIKGGVPACYSTHL